jgi:hypothetical protein
VNGLPNVVRKQQVTGIGKQHSGTELENNIGK